MPEFLFEHQFIKSVFEILNKNGIILFNTMILNKENESRNLEFISKLKKPYSVNKIRNVEKFNELIIIENNIIIIFSLFNKNKPMKKIAIVFVLFAFGCNKSDNSENLNLFYKDEMRNFVIGISQYSKAINPNFAIIPQNGIELITNDGEINGNPSTNYLNAIDGHGQEDLFYGYDFDDQATNAADSDYLKSYLNKSKDFGKKILVTDYCSTPSKMSNSYSTNRSLNYISFAANQRQLNNIPNFPATITNQNSNIITNLSQAQNFLYLINTVNYNSKTDFINAVKATNYDVLITDFYFIDGIAFSSSDVNELKIKANGGKRMVISYISIGEVEDYRYYWNPSWNTTKPAWIDAVNPNWPGNYKVKYWNTEWKNIIYGNNSSYMKKILDANFDGAYLDIIDAFEFYEN